MYLAVGADCLRLTRFLSQIHTLSDSTSTLTHPLLCLQPFFAPFVLTRLRCTGNEARLEDCPGLAPTATDATLINFSGSSFCSSVSTGIADSQSPSFAVIACGTGMDTGAGMLCPGSCSLMRCTRGHEPAPQASPLSMTECRITEMYRCYALYSPTVLRCSFRVAH